MDEVHKLINSGADVNASDHAGWTPLHFAAEYQRADVVDVLIGAGAEVNAKERHGNTPLFRAVFSSKGQGETISKLLRAGADPDITNNHGVTPRALAERIGNFDVSQHLPPAG